MPNKTVNTEDIQNKMRLADSIGRAPETDDITENTYIPVVDPITNETDKYTLRRFKADFINRLNELYDDYYTFVNEMMGDSGKEGFLEKIVSDINDLTTYVVEVEVDSSFSISPELKTNTIYNADKDEEIAMIIIPDLSENIEYDKKYISQLNFTSKNDDNSTVISIESSMDGSLKWLGDDVSDNIFTPVKNKRYTIMFSNDGMFIRAVVQSVEITTEV